ncbi:hypothetical protein TNCV_738341 [Trichonephila clavipes]|nr:hypothetical protein TNCV_738341 [Trichonephila clavipes]
MATGNSGISFGSIQSQANQVKIPPITTQSQTNNPNFNIINQTIQGIIQALSALTVQINNMSLVAPLPRKFNTNNNKNKTKEERKQQMYALVEAIFEHCDD